MKKYLLFIVLINCISFNAQNKIANKIAELQSLKATFRPISVLTVNQNVIDKEVNKVVDGATLASLNRDKVNEIVYNKYDNIQLEIPYQNNTISVLLYKVNPFVEGFHVDTNTSKNISYEKGVFYRGCLKDETNSVASLNFFNGEFNGIISSATIGNLVIGKLDKPNNQSDYIVYSDAKMKLLNQFECHTKENETKTTTNGETNRSGNSVRCVSFYFEIDNNLFIQNGSSTTTTTNWITSVFNNVQTLYNNDGITVGLKSIFIWTTADPYEGVGTTSGAYLNAFSQTTPVFDGDVGQLIGIDPGGLGGVAVSINGLCTQLNYSYADVNFSYATVPTYSWTVEVITHEFGHLLGSPHTHGCYWNGNNTSIDGCGTQAGYSEGTCPLGPIPTVDKGTIMSYCHLVNGVGINFANGFGLQPRQVILNDINGGTCLSFDCTSSCPNTITDITTSSITPTSVQIAWTEVGLATSWQVAVTPFSSSTPVWNTVSATTFTAAGLIPNTYYVIQVRPFCNNLEPANRNKIFATAAINFCANVSFTDTGGLTGNYTNMESWVRTMTPNNPGLKLKVTFSTFNLENNYDYLYIYNGPDEFYPLLTPGGLTGTVNPGIFNSTSSEGSLTLKFYSDQGVVASGWNATINCTGSLNIEDNNFLDYSYYPNPTTGKVAITSKDVITEIAIYNIAGQLLFDQKLNGLNATVDISPFARGTYFFKLKIKDREANFKILKK
ncbi:M12 family metallo-peptidase [Flavobacterium sp.]|uniref:M12 family metallo-peptidase n=1 Tax=Flavobacterium sp. TaxID=239 RepID=UPI0025E682B0|nr:M12 family metallo-peptidase [Flavobacterium sp.]